MKSEWKVNDMTQWFFITNPYENNHKNQVFDDNGMDFQKHWNIMKNKQKHRNTKTLK